MVPNRSRVGNDPQWARIERTSIERRSIDGRSTLIKDKIDRFTALLKNKQDIVSIIHWVLYVFLVSSWHVDGKLLTDYVITISSWAQTRNLSDAASPAYHFTMAFSTVLVYSEENLYFLAAVTIYGTTNIDNFNIRYGNIMPK